MTLETLKLSLTQLPAEDGLKLILEIRRFRRTWVSKKTLQKVDAMANNIANLDEHSRAAVLALLEN